MNIRSRLLPWATAVLLGLSLVGTGAAAITSAAALQPTADGTTLAGSTVTRSASGTGTWRRIAAAPVPTGDYQAVWTGTQLLIHRPNYTAQKGSIDAAYNPSTNRWRRLSSSKYPVKSSEAGTIVVWSGKEMLTFGVLNAAYQPSTGKWRKLAAPPLAGPSVVVWTGSRVLIWGGGCCDDVTNRGASYNPATNRWTALPVAPLAPRHADGVWTGRELIVVGGEAHGEKFYADAAAYNPSTRKWRKLPSLPAPRIGASLTWTGKDVLVVGGERAYGAVPYRSGYAYRPSTNRWRTLPAMDVGRSGHVAVWTGSRLLVWGGYTRKAVNATPAKPAHGLSLNLANRKWSALPKAPITGRRDADAFRAGHRMLIWGGYTVTDSYTALRDGATYRFA
jgi:galactose oxidase-like protein